MQLHIDLHEEVTTLEANRDAFLKQVEMQLMRYDATIAHLRDMLRRHDAIEQAKQQEGNGHSPSAGADLQFSEAEAEMPAAP